MVFDSKKKKEMSEEYYISSWMLVLRYLSMRIFKATLNRVSAVYSHCLWASGVWLLPSLVGFLKFSPLKVPPWNGRCVTEVFWEHAMSNWTVLRTTSSVCSEPPCVLFPILKPALLLLFLKILNSSFKVKRLRFYINFLWGLLSLMLTGRSASVTRDQPALESHWSSTQLTQAAAILAIASWGCSC